MSLSLYSNCRLNGRVHRLKFTRLIKIHTRIREFNFHGKSSPGSPGKEISLVVNDNSQWLLVTCFSRIRRDCCSRRLISSRNFRGNLKCIREDISIGTHRGQRCNIKLMNHSEVFRASSWSFSDTQDRFMQFLVPWLARKLEIRRSVSLIIKRPARHS